MMTRKPYVSKAWHLLLVCCSGFLVMHLAVAGYPRDPGSPNLRMVMELKYLADEVFVHRNHQLTRGLDP